MNNLPEVYELRIQLILKAVQKWLFEDTISLKEQIEKTIELGFERSDIYHSLNWIHEKCVEENLKEWCIESADLKKSETENTVIFFHAGNLPLVGFQDVIISILSGVIYNGKLSSKDPYLLAGFIDSFNKISNSLQLRYSVILEEFENLQANSLVFAGSKQGAQTVLDKAKDLNIINENSTVYLRKAHFSIVDFNRFLYADWMDLAEAILRYNGAGCRSVAIIVSTSAFSFSGCQLRDYSELWLMKNKRGEKTISAQLRYYDAYYKSIGVKTHFWNGTLIVEAEPQRMIHGIVYWVKGDESTLNELILRYKSEIQSVYGVGITSNFEPLFKAQFPDLNWKADGIDLLASI